jgi:hypothetical protein
MAIVITPELILYLSIIIRNLVGKSLKSLEGKSLDEIKAMVLDDKEMKEQLMIEMHSTD